MKQPLQWRNTKQWSSHMSTEIAPPSSALCFGSRPTEHFLSMSIFYVITLLTRSVDTVILGNSNPFYTWPTHTASCRVNTHSTLYGPLCGKENQRGSLGDSHVLKLYACKHPFMWKHLREKPIKFKAQTNAVTQTLFMQADGLDLQDNTEATQDRLNLPQEWTVTLFITY